MPGPDGGLPLPLLFGYGPAPGMELIPYFLALVGWVGLAVLSVLLSPFTALWRRLRRRPAATPTSTPSQDARPATPSPAGPGGSADAAG